MSLVAIGSQSSVTGISTSTGGQPDGSVEANVISTLYDPVRQGVLRAVQWDFARKQSFLTQLKSSQDTNSTCPQPWQYEYSYPSDCLRMRFLQPNLTNTATTSNTIPSGNYIAAPWPVAREQRFIIANDVPYGSTAPVRVVLTNLPTAIGVYTLNVTDPNMFDANFVDAFVHVLASRLVLNLNGDKQMSAQLMKTAEEYLATAMKSDGDEGPRQQDTTPDWIRAHGFVGWDDGYYNSGLGGGGYSYYPWGYY